MVQIPPKKEAEKEASAKEDSAGEDKADLAARVAEAVREIKLKMLKVRSGFRTVEGVINVYSRVWPHAVVGHG